MRATTESLFCNTPAEAPRNRACSAIDACICALPGAAIPVVNGGDDGCTSGARCGACAGDCDDDGDCLPGLRCFQRVFPSDTVPGCAAPYASWRSEEHDYCYGTPRDTTPTPTPARVPTSAEGGAAASGADGNDQLVDTDTVITIVAVMAGVCVLCCICGCIALVWCSRVDNQQETDADASWAQPGVYAPEAGGGEQAAQSHAAVQNPAYEAPGEPQGYPTTPGVVVVHPAGIVRTCVTCGCVSWAVQFHPNSGPFDFGWLPARTMHPPCGPSVRVVSQTKSRKIPTRKILPLFPVVRAVEHDGAVAFCSQCGTVF